MSEACQIGLLAYVENEEQLHKVEHYMHHLQSLGKEVHLLLFVPGKEAPHYIMPRLSVDIVPRKMVNWFGIPQGKVVKSFQQKKFDLLIDLCMEHHKENLYIAITSNASMRVGLYGDNMLKYYDFMLSGSKNKIRSFEQYTQEIEKYLNQLKTNKS
ncbi:MAG: DUF6913 domain-containing protein [Bacteroidota bacterium]